MRRDGISLSFPGPRAVRKILADASDRHNLRRQVSARLLKEAILVDSEVHTNNDDDDLACLRLPIVRNHDLPPSYDCCFP